MPHAEKTKSLNKNVYLCKNNKFMETIQIDILNPKAIRLLKNLAELNLIRIQKENLKSEFQELLDNLRINSDEAPSPEEIAEEVEAIRKARYEK